MRARRTGRCSSLCVTWTGPICARLLLDEGPLAPDRAIAIAEQLAGALDAAHARGLVHRDVKPSNVLIDHGEGREHCYLADFGLSQSVANRPATDGELLGTVDYVAPEQIRGDSVDGPADEYAFGCLFYEALTGERPFAGSSDIATIYSHLEEEPPPASVRRPELPAAVDAVLARAMAKDPEKRYGSCGSLVEEARLALGVAAAPPARRHRLGAAVAALALVAAVAVAALAVALRDEPSATPPPGGSLVRIDTGARAVAERLPTAAAPSHVVVAGDQLWFASGGALWRLGPHAGSPVHVDTVGPVHGLAALGDTVFVAREGKGLLEGLVVPYGSDGFRGDGVALTACSLGAAPSVGLWASDCQGSASARADPGPRARGRERADSAAVPDDLGDDPLVPLRHGGRRGHALGSRRPRRPARLADRSFGQDRRDDRASSPTEEHRGSAGLGVDHGAARRRRAPGRREDEPGRSSDRRRSWGGGHRGRRRCGVGREPAGRHRLADRPGDRPGHRQDSRRRPADRARLRRRQPLDGGR